MTFHKIEDAVALPNLRLAVRFADGTDVEYDVASLASRMPAFGVLRDESLFREVMVDPGGYGVSWGDDLDVSCDELWDGGVVAHGHVREFGLRRP